MLHAHIKCDDRILDAAPAYHIRRPHIGCGARISYAVTAYWMRHPNTIFGDRILYTEPAYHMRRPHIVCGSPIYFPEPHVKMWNPQRSCGCQRNSNVTVCFGLFIIQNNNQTKDKMDQQHQQQQRPTTDDEFIRVQTFNTAGRTADGRAWEQLGRASVVRSAAAAAALLQQGLENHGDSHCWIELPGGQIFDPTHNKGGATQIEITMCQIYKIDQSALVDPKYQAYAGDKLARYQAAHDAQFQADIRTNEMMSGNPDHLIEQTRLCEYSAPQYCFSNARCWLLDHPDRGGVLRTGKKGYVTRSGSIHWEYG